MKILKDKKTKVNNSKEIIHNLPSLYHHTMKFSPDLVDKFEFLEGYCVNETTDLNVGVRSLKHAVYALRPIISQRDLENFFYFILCEALALGKENSLYEMIFDFRAIKPYINKIGRLQIDIPSLPIENCENHKILINNNEINISGRAIRELPDLSAVLTIYEDNQLISFDINRRSKLAKDIDLLKTFVNELNKRCEGWELKTMFDGQRGVCVSWNAKEKANSKMLTVKDILCLLDEAYCQIH